MQMLEFVRDWVLGSTPSPQSHQTELDVGQYNPISSGQGHRHAPLPVESSLSASYIAAAPVCSSVTVSSATPEPGLNPLRIRAPDQGTFESVVTNRFVSPLFSF